MKQKHLDNLYIEYKVNNIIRQCKYSLNHTTEHINNFIIYFCKRCQKRIFLATNFEVKFLNFYIIINIVFDFSYFKNVTPLSVLIIISIILLFFIIAEDFSLSTHCVFV